MPFLIFDVSVIYAILAILPVLTVPAISRVMSKVGVVTMKLLFMSSSHCIGQHESSEL